MGLVSQRRLLEKTFEVGLKDGQDLYSKEEGSSRHGLSEGMEEGMSLHRGCSLA